MSALVIVETHFGTTRHIAEIVAEVLRFTGIGTEVVSVVDAPTQIDDDIDLLVIGAGKALRARRWAELVGARLRKQLRSRDG